MTARLAAELADALARGAARRPELISGDMREAMPEARPFTPAAVLVAITDRPEPGVLLTQRPEHMRRHPGQVAFPGGRVEPGEEVIAAALREAEEEIALPPAAVHIVGAVETYRTVTGFEVTPVLGVVPPDLALTPNAEEVADWFEAPFEYLLDPKNQHEREADWQGARRRYWEILWQERRIWGATAAMIVNLGRRLRG